ncbi:ArsR/SmtB family transcription factor [Pinibacter soli]|uniref:Metalloregulator ArsR/SmtB family transcription factor n=1 Tax=Pinibacter soli TaxID=3044211 RepID=A0ABT6RCT4_9BACT|nr:metalloregulator ArsR/SmtB family transcription factor [Pinibacter soli]MDI3320381.1 metalloregulator ArsR/SmtB family transcription factor [Pinibacter soli]
MSIEARRDVFQAIADPTRRQIISLVAKQSMNLNAIAENFDISRPAISQHIKILTECGMIVIKKQGRERYCEAKLDKLVEVSAWVDQYKQFWNEKFNALDKYLHNIQLKNKTKNNSK